MKIGLDNYEEFFLLYLDNELTAGDRAMVEVFLNDHPHLKAEFELLQQTILLPDEILMSDKSALLFNAGNTIHEGNYEEWFLLYADKELTPAQQTSVEVFVLQNPALQSSFDAIMKTILVPEQMVCTFKGELYKKEKSRRPFLYFSFSQMAVAAAFITVVVSGWMLFKQPPATNSALTANNRNINQKPSVKTQPPAPTVSTPQQQTESNQAANTYEKYTAVANRLKTPSTEKQPPSVIKEQRPEPRTEPSAHEPLLAENKPAPQLNFDELKKMLTENPADEIALNTDETLAGKVQQLKVIDIDDDNENNLLIGNLQLNKRKVNGIISSARQLLKGNSNTSK